MMIDKRLSYLNLEPPALRRVGLRVAAQNGVNLAQGLCMMPTPSVVLEAAQEAIRSGKNLYTPPQGIPELRKALSERLATYNRVSYSPDEIVVTCGSTGAFESVCQSFLDQSDEIVTFIPFYPYHHNALLRRQVKTNYVPLYLPDWRFEPDELAAAITPKTKFILLATPHNPTGKVFSQTELSQIAALCQKHDIFCVTDEVYEYITYPGHPHISIASLPGMRERTITMSSYSKTFAITGWRIGFVAAPSAVADLLRVTFDQLYVCAPSPFQYGVAEGIRSLNESHFTPLRAEYLSKRNRLADAFAAAGFTVSRPQGAYYLIADTRTRFPGKSSEEVVDILVDRCGVGAVPASDFVGPETKGDPEQSHFLRISYAVPDALLDQAAERLRRL